MLELPPNRVPVSLCNQIPLHNLFPREDHHRKKTRKIAEWTKGVFVQCAQNNCNQSFDKTEFRKHFVTKHGSDKFFNCPICYCQFDIPSSVQRHINYQHKTEHPPFEQFNQKESLTGCNIQSEIDQLVLIEDNQNTLEELSISKPSVSELLSTLTNISTLQWKPDRQNCIKWRNV